MERQGWFLLPDLVVFHLFSKDGAGVDLRKVGPCAQSTLRNVIVWPSIRWCEMKAGSTAVIVEMKAHYFFPACTIIFSDPCSL